MAEQVRAAYQLPTLRIRLDRTTRGPAQAVFDLIHGEEETTLDGVDPKALGLPDEVTSSRDVPERGFALPPQLPVLIAAAIGPSAENPELWLELPFPRGYLHLVPWERLLSPALGRPIRRLPNYTLRPHAPGDSLRVLLCASQPAAKAPFPARELLSHVTDAWTTTIDRRVSVHVFGDYGLAAEARDAFQGRPEVTVHDPDEAAEFDLPSRTRELSEATGEVTSPWLMWMESALGGLAADVVHFIGHGYLSGDQGALALASSPVLNTDRKLARFIGVTQLSGFMARVGAWSLALTGPPHNFSPAGLRELADAVALIRPGIALVQDADLDPKMTELQAALQMIYGASSPRRPLPAISSWSHPAAVEFGVESSSELLSAEGESTLFAESTESVLARDETPAWVAAGARALETLQADWFSNATMPADQEAITALRRVTGLFDEHVRAHVSGTDAS